MSEHNMNTINMYKSGGALEYIENSKIDPETEKWERLFNYIEEQLEKNKNKKIIEFGSGCGELALILQSFGYDITATDIVDDFLKEEKQRGITKIKKFNFLNDNYDNHFDYKADLIISWRNPHLDINDLKRLFMITHSALSNNGLLIINFQNAEVHPEADILPNGTRYNYKILKEKQTKEKRFYAYYSKEEIEELVKELFTIIEYHTEGGKEQKNWHVLTLKKK